MQPKPYTIQDCFLKKKRNNIFLFQLFFIIFFFVSCTQKNLTCWNEQKTQSETFVFDDTLKYLVVRRFLTYNVLASQSGPLRSEMPEGAYRLKISPDFVDLEEIQDRVYTKTRLPSGQFIKSSSAIQTQEDYLKRRSYHSVYPVIRRYIFNRKTLQLTLSFRPLPKPRSAIELKLVYEKATDSLRPDKARDLKAEELSELFPAHEKTSVYLYPNCEQKTFFSIIKKKGKLILLRFQIVFQIILQILCTVLFCKDIMNLIQ